MKISKLKINKNAVSKLAAYVLAGSLVTGALTGCQFSADKESLVKGTILENVYRVTFQDGGYDVAIAICDCNDSGHNHYYSLMYQQYYSDKNCPEFEIEGNECYHYAIANEESIICYLTQDDIEKAREGKLNSDDLIQIVNRVPRKTEEEDNIKTR